jgi:hypothetical protein
LCAALATGAACNALDKIITLDQSAPIATISMNAQAKGGGFVTSPGAFFYRAVGSTAVSFTTVGTPRDTCNLRALSGFILGIPVDTLPLAATPLSAGGFVTMRLSGTTDTLLPPSAQSVGYRMAQSTSHAFAPGDTVTFVVPGSSSGFPAASVSLRTAEAFATPALKFAPSGEDLPVTWTPPAAPGSVINLAITYKVGVASYQIYCQFVDDGQAVIPASYFTSFPGAQAGFFVGQYGYVDIERMRTTLVQLPGSGAIVNVISVFEVPTPVSP